MSSSLVIPIQSEEVICTINILDESFQIPCEGIFWVINDKLISFTDQVNPSDPYDSTDLLHKDVWESIKHDFLVNNHEVAYDYFPRGRVETLPILDSNNFLDHYEASVYMDKCISSRFRETIESDFKLYLSNVHVSYDGQLFIDGSHYTCHNCR